MSTAYTGTDVLEIMEDAHNYNAFIRDLIKAHSPGLRVLDFGAGNGVFARLLREHNFEVVCVEPDDILCARLREQGFEVHKDLSTCPAFDFIYSINVLEHISNDHEIFAKLVAKLTASGRILIYVPAFMALYSSFDKKIGHLRRYRRRDLLNLARSLRVHTCRHTDILGFFAALLYRQIDRGDGHVSTRSLWLFDRWIFPLSLWLDRLTGRPFGKNLLLIADKTT